MHELRLLGIRFKTDNGTKDCNTGGKKLYVHVKCTKSHNKEKMILLKNFLNENLMNNLCFADRHRLTMLLDGFDESRVKMTHVNFLRWFSKKYQESQEKKKLGEEKKKKEKEETNQALYDESTR